MTLCRAAPFLLTGLLAPALLRAEATWVEVQSPNFTVVSDAGIKDARRVAWQFEQVRALFQRLWPWARVKGGKPLLVLAARDEGSLRSLLPQFWERKGSGHPAGILVSAAERHYIVLRADLTDVAGDDNPYQVLYHEYVHLLLDLNFHHVPVWFNEGLAELYAATIVTRDSIYQGRVIPWHIGLLRERKLLPLPTLLKVDQASPEYNEQSRQSLFYAQSWALVHYLMLADRAAHAAELNRFGQLLKQGVSGEEAVRQALGDVQDLERRLEQYIHRFAFTYRRFDTAVEIKAEAFPAREMPAAESAAVRGAFYVATNRLAEARSVLAQALERGADLAAVHEARGLLAFREGHPDEALQSIARAVELDSRDFLAHFLYATLPLDHENSSEALARAEASLRKALEINPEFAPALDALSKVLVERGHAEDAVALSRRAVAIEPGGVHHRLILAWVLLEAGKREEARQEAQRAVAAARSPEDRQAAEQYMKEVTSTAAPARGTSAVRPVPLPQRTVSVLESGCQAGEMDTCAELGYRYRKAIGVAADPGRAAGYAQRACDGGNARGCSDLGWLRERGEGVVKDEAAAAALYGKACEGGETWACLQLGSLHERGRGVAPDPTRAAELYRNVCAAEQVVGCVALGRLMQAGKGMPRDEAGAVALYRKGCEGNDPWGCVRLAVMYASGRGVARDPAEAARLFDKACASDEPDGCAGLGSLYERGLGVAADAARAAALYEKACNGGSGWACGALANQKLTRDAPDDPAAAAGLLRKGCEAGDATSCGVLAVLHEIGKGVEKRAAEARALHEKACAAGYSPSCDRLKALPRPR